jgi:hypothetical protein
MTPKRRKSKRQTSRRAAAPEPLHFPAARRDAKIKGFEMDRQRKVIGWWAEKGEAHARRMIKREWGLSVGCTAFYAALAFWRSSSKYAQVEAEARVQMEQEVASKGSMSPEEKHAALERNFLTIAAASADTETFLEFRKLELKRREVDAKQSEAKAKLKHRSQELDRKERELALAIDKFQFDGAKAALKFVKELKAIAADRSLSSDDKIAAVRLKLWGTAPEVKA